MKLKQYTRIVTLVFYGCLSTVAQFYDLYETCEDRDNGVYPLRDCFKYMKCINQTKTITECPKNNLYDASVDECVHQLNFTEDNYCHGRNSGDWMNPWDCHKFFSCNFGWHSVHECLDNLAYDPVSDSCIDEKDVPYCNMLSVHNVTKYQGNSLNFLSKQSPSLNGNLSSVDASDFNKSNANSSMKVLPAPTTSTIEPDVSTLGNSSDLITPNELKGLLQSGNVRLIDVREPWELQTVGKISQSKNIPVGQVYAAFSLSPDQFKATYNMYKPAKDDCRLVFHCKTGVRSQIALDSVKSLGYTCAKSLKGGFTTWKMVYA